MKQFCRLMLTVAFLFCLCACQGNFGSINLKDPVEIPADGVITESTLGQIKNENAIAIFQGSSENIPYEWTVFGSAIREVKEVNLGVQVEKSGEGDIRVILRQKEYFGFTATLAIHLNESWDANRATAYAGETPVDSVTLTGSKHTILNIRLDGTVGELAIRPNRSHEESGAVTDTEEPQVPSAPTQTEPETKPTQPETTSKPTENGGKDKYFTDPVPEGKPNPVEPEDQEVDQNITYTCTFSIECTTILNNLEMLDAAKLEMVPYDGVILKEVSVTFYEGESVFNVLQRVCREFGIHMEAEWTPIYNSAYIEGIHNLYEFDCGALSGWMYKVNDWYPNYGCSRYQLADGDVVEWRYTCDLGNDVGGGYAIGG